MGKPRQRHTHSPIIDKQEFRSPGRQAVEGSITAILWAIWMYWILPVITVMLWAIGIKLFHHTLFATEQFRQLHLVLRNGGLALLTIFAINLLWIYYNYRFIYRRFGRRRKVSRHSDDLKLAEFYHIEEKTIVKAKEHNRFEITLLDGKITIQSAKTIQK